MTDEDLSDYVEELKEDLCRKEAIIESLTAQLAMAREALENIAEECDAGRHDGLPEPYPAHEDVIMWMIARQAIAKMEQADG